jgi:hypothetical protein
MNNGHHHQKIECLACELPTQERLNYFTGQFLTQRDFLDEQAYLMGKHRQHNHYLHGYGTVCGLKVVPHDNPKCQTRFVVIQPGLALDCCGREILLRDKVYVDLEKALAPIPSDLAANDKNNLLISLCYSECKTEFVQALYSECSCDETGCEANRIYEEFEVDVKLVNNGKVPKSPFVDLTSGNHTLESCKKLFWQALEGCPECPEDACVPLAVIREYEKGIAIDNTKNGHLQIDNEIRPMVLSNATIQQLILCALRGES